MIEQNFVTFVSPGTFVHEKTTKKIKSWDVNKAIEMARRINERHNATPHSFYFATRRNDGEMDSKEVKKSCTYFLGGEVFSLEQIKARGNDSDGTLIFNMECNNIARVIENKNSWKDTLELKDDDVVLEFVPAAAASGHAS